MSDRRAAQRGAHTAGHKNGCKNGCKQVPVCGPLTVLCKNKSKKGRGGKNKSQKRGRGVSGLTGERELDPGQREPVSRRLRGSRTRVSLQLQSGFSTGVAAVGPPATHPYLSLQLFCIQLR